MTTTNDRPYPMLSNHARVLIDIAHDPTTRLRDIAGRVGITERAVFGIVEQLERDGAIERHKVGRRNTYTIDPDATIGSEAMPVSALVGLPR